MRGTVVAEVGVARVAGLAELVVVVERRRRGVVGAAPEHELLLAVLLEGLRLVLALQGAVVPLVQPPVRRTGIQCRSRLVEGEVGRRDRAAQQRGVHDVRQQPGVASAARRRGRPRRGPWSDRSTSTQPVNRFFAFQSLSPWRSSTSVSTVMRRRLACAGCPGRSGWQSAGVLAGRRSPVRVRRWAKASRLRSRLPPLDPPGPLLLHRLEEAERQQLVESAVGRVEDDPEHAVEVRRRHRRPAAPGRSGRRHRPCRSRRRAGQAQVAASSQR